VRGAVRSLHAGYRSQVGVRVNQPWDQELAVAIDLHTAIQWSTADFRYASSFDPNVSVLQGGRSLRGDYRYIADDRGRGIISG